MGLQSLVEAWRRLVERIEEIFEDSVKIAIGYFFALSQYLHMVPIFVSTV